MRVHLLTLRYSPTLGGFDERPLAEALRDKQVLEVREHFFTVHDVPHLACLITYEAGAAAPPPLPPQPPAAASRTHAGRRSGASDPFGEVSETERVLCQSLRQWRAERARKDGLPPYLILTNREIVAIVHTRPASHAALEALEGLGPGRVKRFGDAILAHLEAHDATASRAAPALEGAPAAAPGAAS